MTQQMQMKHTPGPWMIVKGGHEPRMVKISDVVSGGFLGVATAFGDTEEEAWANARLIAAAPDLLAAAEAVTPYLWRILRSGKSCIDCAVDEGSEHDENCSVGSLLAAIAKAKGGAA